MNLKITHDKNDMNGKKTPINVSGQIQSKVWTDQKDDCNTVVYTKVGSNIRSRTEDNVWLHIREELFFVLPSFDEYLNNFFDSIAL